MELRVLLLLLLCCPGLPARTPDAEMSQREGSTFSIECPYTAQPDNKQLKAWCRVRNERCELVVLTLASTEYRYSDRARQGHITIQDDNRTVSITMSDLQAEDSGIYSCVYSSNYVPLKTISLNVYKDLPAQTPEAEMSQREGSTFSIECPYTAQPDNKQLKAWCRVRNERCELVAWILASMQYIYSDRARQSHITIQDDNRTVSITMSDLQAEDSGIYSCMYSSNYVPLKTISLNVYKVPAATTLSVTTGSSQKNSSGNSTQPRNTIIISVVLCILLILALAITTTLGIRQRKKLKTKGNREAEDTYDKPEDTYDKPESPAQLESAERMRRTTDDSRDVNYITLDFKSQLSSDEPLYCNVELSQTPRKPIDENVEYAIITSKQLPRNDKG
uniref:Ig-like domain-containing protein n=1 Tax=Chrysolophus pictus TaxID=9089 RepID=A0A8C3LV76_CHRPC